MKIAAPVALVSATHRAEVTARVEELERAGQPVLLVCLDRTRHEHESTRADVLHVPLLSMGMLASLARDRGRALGLLPAMLVRLPSAVHLAQLLPRRGVAEVQGLDPLGAKVADAVRRLCELKPPDLTELPVDWSRLGAERAGLRWLSRRINSIAAEVSLGDQRVVVKRQRDHVGGSAASRWAHESAVLASLRQAMGDGPLTVPRVLLADEASSLLVMERAPGLPLDAMFADVGRGFSPPPSGGKPALELAVRGAGAWLAAMQAATRRKVDARALLAEVVAIARDDAARVLPRERAKIVAQLDALEKRVSTRPLLVAGHHDDYWPGNIFYDGERVTVIDFESFRDGLALEDAAFFLIRCDLLRRRFRVDFPDLAQRFFEGYGAAPDPDALRLFTITKGLRGLARGMGEDLPMPQRLWTRRTIRNAILGAM